MSDQSKDQPQGPAVTTGVATSQDSAPETRRLGQPDATVETFSGGVPISVSISETGAPTGVTTDATHSGGVLNPDTNMRNFNPPVPEAIPGPTVEEMRLGVVEDAPEPKSAADQIMERAHREADAIVKAAEDAVAAMDAEAKAVDNGAAIPTNPNDLREAEANRARADAGLPTDQERQQDAAKADKADAKAETKPKSASSK